MNINGKEMSIDVNSITELLNHLKISLQMVVVEVNGNIIDKKIYDDRVLKADDKIEIVSFVGGG